MEARHKPLSQSENELATTNNNNNNNKRKKLCIGVCIAVCIAAVVLAMICIIVKYVFLTTKPGFILHPSDSLISYNSSHKDNVYITELNKFIKAYETLPSDSILCNDTTKPGPGESCQYREEWLGGVCKKDNSWGYTINNTHPCILVTPNMVPYWVPDTYKTEEELPEEMPQYLKNNIIDSIYDVGHISKFAWVSCEVLSGEGYCSLTPWFGFPDYFFPYNTNTNYRSPVLSARVDWRGAQKKYVKLRFQMWAKNLDPKETIQTITVEANQSN
ncbi:hypothetical protein Pmani_011827 [Petrolisthes manimaculis]|uniref:Uncharacterized protein n=1 Tax=Petrolisthes manimaculis TaxID=1843537 RepID=A0AAE1Q1R1_9EUCA|nr:hypothetical protein Pmani_011827 [Petrolisthes manimaculis]